MVFKNLSARSLISSLRYPHHSAKPTQDRHGGDSGSLSLPSTAHPKTRPGMKSWLYTHYPGWRAGVALGAVLCSAVCIINIITAVYTYMRKQDNSSGNQERGPGATFYSGSCSKAKKLGFGLHLLINVLSTLMLAASNYTMQCLSSPTREEINTQHEKRRTMKVGVTSFSNLWKIQRRRAILYMILALTSAPIHLLYNSAVFTTLVDQVYNAHLLPRNLVEVIEQPKGEWATRPEILKIQGTFNYPKKWVWKRLDMNDCITAYGKAIVSDRMDVILVFNGTESLRQLFPTKYMNNPDFGKFVPGLFVGEAGFGGDIETAYDHLRPSFQFLCPKLPRSERGPSEEECLRTARSGPLQYIWKNRNVTVDHCVSQTVDEQCTVGTSLPILITVIVCNFLKAVCMVLALWTVPPSPLLVTVGDVVQCMLEDPDSETDATSAKAEFSPSGWAGPTTGYAYKPRTFKWYQSVSRTRWSATVIIFVVVLTTVGGLLRVGLNYYRALGIPTDLRSLIKEGFAPVTTHNMFALWHSSVIRDPLVTTALVANFPQLLLAIIYFMFNALFTCYLRSAEWTKMAVQQKSLRVTEPRGNQRSTHWLQLPFRYAIPLNLVSGSLHTLISQSIYLIVVESWSHIYRNEIPNEYSVYCAFSPLGVITILLLAPILLVAASCLGFQKYPIGMTTCVPNSAVISAACQSQEQELEMDRMRWGVVENDDGRKTLGFSRQPQEPIEGEVYR